MRQWYIT